MKRLIVYLSGEPVGALDQDANGLLAFRYAPEWLGAIRATPLSRSLPLREEPFRGKHARPFFAGILPDEGPRQQIAAILGISARNDFAMLERIGGECAGAVCLLPNGAPPPALGERKRAETERAGTAEDHYRTAPSPAHGRSGGHAAVRWRERKTNSRS